MRYSVMFYLLLHAEPFTTDVKSFTNHRVHLTNSAVGATVHPIADFWDHLDHTGVDRVMMRNKLKDLVVKAVFSAQVNEKSFIYS